MAIRNYGIKRKAITKRNPQANTITESIHQTLGNILRNLDKDNVNEDDCWFDLRSTYHTTTQATPTQLVFGSACHPQHGHWSKWKYIHDHKQQIICKNNQREKSKQIPHTYHVGDKVLLNIQDIKTKIDAKYDSSYEVFQVNNNGTVCICKGTVSDTVNISITTPCHKQCSTAPMDCGGACNRHTYIVVLQ